MTDKNKTPREAERFNELLWIPDKKLSKEGDVLEIVDMREVSDKNTLELVVKVVASSFRTLSRVPAAVVDGAISEYTPVMKREYVPFIHPKLTPDTYVCTVDEIHDGSSLDYFDFNAKLKEAGL